MPVIKIDPNAKDWRKERAELIAERDVWKKKAIEWKSEANGRLRSWTSLWNAVEQLLDYLAAYVEPHLKTTAKAAYNEVANVVKRRLGRKEA